MQPLSLEQDIVFWYYTNSEAQFWRDSFIHTHSLDGHETLLAEKRHKCAKNKRWAAKISITFLKSCTMHAFICPLYLAPFCFVICFRSLKMAQQHLTIFLFIDSVILCKMFLTLYLLAILHDVPSKLKWTLAILAGKLLWGVWLQMGAVRVKAKWCRMFPDIHETVLKQRGTVLQL